MKVNGKKADDSSDAPMLCDICRSEYTVKTITNHYRRSHPDKYFPEGKRKEYKCNHCEETFFSTQGKYLSYNCYLIFFPTVTILNQSEKLGKLRHSPHDFTRS